MIKSTYKESITRSTANMNAISLEQESYESYERYKEMQEHRQAIARHIEFLKKFNPDDDIKEGHNWLSWLEDIDCFYDTANNEFYMSHTCHHSTAISFLKKAVHGVLENATIQVNTKVCDSEIWVNYNVYNGALGQHHVVEAYDNTPVKDMIEMLKRGMTKKISAYSFRNLDDLPF